MDIRNKNISEILNGREKRAETQKKLIEKFKLPLVSFTLNIPGAYKIGDYFLKVYKTGIDCFEKKAKESKMKIVYKEEKSSAAGYEAFFCIDSSAFKIKKITVAIEEEHKLGRLFDFDVLDADGKHIKRTELSFHERKCFICGENAVICGRSRKHSADELLNKVKQIIDDYYDK